MSGFARDLGQAVRHAMRRPISSLVIILTFALGVGANTALFSVTKAVWLDAVPYPTGFRAMQVMAEMKDGGGRFALNMPEVLDLRADPNSPFEVMAAVVQAGGIQRLEPGGRAFFARGADAEIFQIFPEQPLLGRLFTAADQKSGEPVVLITEAFWRNWLGSDPQVVGRTLTLAAARNTTEAVTIIGVLPQRFTRYVRGAALLRPMRQADIRMQRAGRGGETVYALVRDGVSIRAARRRLHEIGRQWETREPLFARFILTGDSVRTVMSGPSVAGALAALFGIAVLVLLISCANIANLLIAGAEDRVRELAVRASLGASRRRLLTQLMAESIVLSVAGAAGALALLYLLREAFVALIPVGVLGTENIGINGTVLAFSLLTSLACALVAGLWPAIRLSGAAPVMLLASTSRAGRRRGISSWLLAGQIAAGVIVVVAGVLVARSFIRLAAVDPGFDPNGVLLVSIRGTASGPQAPDALLEAVRTLPMVEAAGAAESIPMGSSRVRYGVRPDGGSPDTQKMLDYRRISAGYLEAMGMRIVRGRAFSPSDTAGSDKVAIMNEQAARLMFPGEDPVGRRVNAGGGGICTIVGVVNDVHHMGLDADAVPEIFRPHTQEPLGGFALAVRAKPDSPGLADALRNLSATPVLGLSMHDIRSAREHVGRSLREPWFRTVLFAVMSGLVLVLTVLGVAALAAHAVIRRTREIGVRMAIGSTPSQAVTLLLRQALVPAAAGAAFGLVGAWWATRVIGRFLFSVDARDLPSFAWAAALMLAGAALAAWLPARRAARIDPAIALRID